MKSVFGMVIVGVLVVYGAETPMQVVASLSGASLAFMLGHEFRGKLDERER